MARIFLSHSSMDDATAIAVRDWLSLQGWDDVFLDLDPERGIVAGERWERALHDAVNRCEVVVFVVSRAWLSSRWCLKEFNLAFRLSKRMFALLVEDIPVAELPPDLTANWQIVRLHAGVDHEPLRVSLPNGHEEHVTFSRSALKALRNGLSKAGLDPRFFEWPPQDDPARPPYPGMRPLAIEDAGIFFGREAPVIEALDKLRGFADLNSRVFVILGASGAGKSSFLRAGLLPRLARDDRHFATLPLVRPERKAVQGRAGLVSSIEAARRAAARPLSRARISEILADPSADLSGLLLGELAEAARPPILEGGAPVVPQPALVLPIDQGEELFADGDNPEATQFLSILRRLVTAENLRLIVLVAMRSDSYEALQAAQAMAGIEQSTMSLPPLPRGAYATVIEGPAARLRDTRRPLTIEPALTAALLGDIESGGAKDALPLLAFTLERLYVEHGGDGDLTLAEYRELGGIAGSINAAVERALSRADADDAVPRDREARLALLRRAIIPWLAGIDPETNAPRRRVARLSEIPEEARPLVQHLVAERLLSIEQAFSEHGQRRGEVTVEPVHEALLRQWGLLEGWLKDEAGAFSIASSIKSAVAEWEANGRGSAWLSHQAGRLEDALALSSRTDFAEYFGDADRAYLDAAVKADRARRDRELADARALAEARGIAANRQRQVTARTRVGAAVAGLLACVALVAAYFGWQSAITANKRLGEAVATAETVVSDIATEFGKQKSMPIGLVRRVLERSISLLDRLAERSEDPQVRLAKARALTETGYAFRTLGDLESAARTSSSLHELLDTVASVAADLDIRRLRAGAFRLSGDVALASQQAQPAFEAYEKEVELRQSVASEFPDDASTTNELTLAMNRLADAMTALGRREDAHEIYRNQLTIRQELLAKDPGSPELKRQVAVSLLKIADGHSALNEPDLARKALNEAIVIVRQLVDADSENGEYARDLATMVERLGTLDLADGRLGAAHDAFEKALEIRTGLAEKNPDRVDWAREEAAAADQLAHVKMQQEAFGEAKTLFTLALGIRLRLYDDDQNSLPRLRDLFLSRISLGDLGLIAGKNADAAQQFAFALAASETARQLAPNSNGVTVDRILAISKLAEAEDDRGLQAMAEVEQTLTRLSDASDISERERAAIREVERIIALIKSTSPK